MVGDHHGILNVDELGRPLELLHLSQRSGWGSGCSEGKQSVTVKVLIIIFTQAHSFIIGVIKLFVVLDGREYELLMCWYVLMPLHYGLWSW